MEKIEEITPEQLLAQYEDPQPDTQDEEVNPETKDEEVKPEKEEEK